MIERQRDTDATWTKKHVKSYCGYKNHVKVMRATMLIDRFEITTASTRDCVVTGMLSDPQEEGGKELYADNAYDGEPVRRHLRANSARNRIQKKAAKGACLTEYGNRVNRKWARVQVRIEHPFCIMEKSLAGLRERSIGIDRAFVGIGLKYIAYNMKRFAFLSRTG